MGSPQVYQGLLELNPSHRSDRAHARSSISGIIRVEPQQLSSEVVLFHTVYQGLLESNPNDPSDHPELGTSIPKPIQLLQKFDSVSQRINAHDYSLKARKCKVDDVIFSIYHLLTWIDYPNDRINSPILKSHISNHSQKTGACHMSIIVRQLAHRAGTVTG